jgi:hypothetical protein
VHLLKTCFRSLAALLLVLPLAALAATPITGTVTNRTTNKPSSGDTVTLIRLAQGMQEVTHTTTNGRGEYTLDTPNDGMFLVRVTHEKANYFGPAPAGMRKVDIDVFNVSAHVEGVTTEAIVQRAQTDAGGGQLNVVENLFVKNDSQPAMTQFSNDPFDFYLPEGAVVEASAAMAPNGMPVSAVPVPLADKGHYTFLFPIRPGETRFQISFHVPYSGSFKFDPKISQATDTFAVIIPKAMTFSPNAGTQFNPITDDPNTQTFVARKLNPGEPLGFQLSGTGALPRDSQQAGQAGQQGDNGGPDAATNDTAPGKGLGNPLDPNGTREPLLTKYKFWILGALGLLLVAVAGVLLRKPAVAPVVAAAPVAAVPLPVVATTAAGHRELLLGALKEELFALETDHLQGKISEDEYVQQKAAVELILRRALQRGV